MKNKPEILFEDPSIVIVNKPANYLSIPDRYDPDFPSVRAFLQHKYDDIFTVHRLDKETSGIMVFAKNAAAHKSLNEQFENRRTNKIYQAIVSGVLHNESGTIEKAIARRAGSGSRMIISNKGKASLSEYKVLEKFKHYTLLEVKIKTGRTHQIRVHMEAIGYPLAVDALYSRNSAFYLSELKGKKYRINRETQERPLISRCTLHAYELSFDHPESGETLTFQANLPKDMRAMLNQLRKWDQ